VGGWSPGSRRVREPVAVSVRTEITFQALTPTIGAEVAGVDLREPLDGETVAQLRQGLLTHLVLFFRDQDITVEQHRRFAEAFGEIDVPPFRSIGVDDPDLTVLDMAAPKGMGADSWHADFTHRPEPPMGSVLRAVELPGAGGDTCFASMYAAYDALSEPVRRFLDGLSAVHTLAITAERAKRTGPPVVLAEESAGGYPTFVHPVVRVHPETGRKLLYVNANWTSAIDGVTDAESAVLLPFLLQHVRSPEFQCRFRWAPNSVAFWDNRAVQHYAVADYTERRLMQRFTIKGDRPFGPGPDGDR
jgi:taurine dioxygenase